MDALDSETSLIEAAVIGKDEALSADVQSGGPIAIGKRLADVQPRFEDYVGAFVGQLRVDGRLSRVAIAR